MNMELTKYQLIENDAEADTNSSRVLLESGQDESMMGAQVYATLALASRLQALTHTLRHATIKVDQDL